jgi:hypothetical protein
MMDVEVHTETAGEVSPKGQKAHAAAGVEPFRGHSKSRMFHARTCSVEVIAAISSIVPAFDIYCGCRSHELVHICPCQFVSKHGSHASQPRNPVPC